MHNNVFLISADLTLVIHVHQARANIGFYPRGDVGVANKSHAKNMPPPHTHTPQNNIKKQETYIKLDKF